MRFLERVVAVHNQDKKRRVLYYGGRKTDKLVRCYHKQELGVFRVEVELHSSLLRQHGISTLADFVYLPDVICPNHLLFIGIDWKRLDQYLSTNLDEGAQVSIEARKRVASLRRLRHYLRRKGVVNFHRFLVSTPLNGKVSRALERWARHFRKEIE